VNTKKVGGRVTLSLFLMSTLLCCVHSASAGPNRDPKAVETARDMMQAMGGVEAWNSARIVSFDFKVTVNGTMVANNAHLWDRKGGRYRIERMPKDGKREVILFNIADYERDKQGSAYLDGKKLEGDAAKKSLEAGYASYINDTWWLAMPWKWMQTGVNLKYLGPQPCGRETCDVVELTFDHVGLTPGDMYHAFVSRKSHLMIHWEYVLQSGRKGSWDWQYGDHKGIKLASNHVSSDHKTTINMGNVRILETVDDPFFTDPRHMLSSLK